ncbi:MAG: hypothetical protein L0211_22170 [Planctomycetaceae bacterium]|nr:hypothetical protein [Planctomycetaceae bacterium]
MTEQRGSLKSLAASCAILAGVLAPLTAAIAVWAYSRSALVGVAAAAIAGGVCWLSACLALVSVYLGQRLNNPVGGILAGMFFRMGLPLGAGLAIQQSHAPLAAAGSFLMILGLYFVALVVETILSIKFVPRSIAGPASGSSGGAANGPSVASGVSGR